MKLTRITEHARLKDHIASMPGGLEAKIQEGGKQDSSLSFLIDFSAVRSFVRRHTVGVFQRVRIILVRRIPAVKNPAMERAELAALCEVGQF